MNIASRGATMAVDWEQRVNFDRLRSARLERTKAALRASDLGALLLFDPNNLRYVTSTAIGTWERDKNIRFALVFRDEDPILWDFGSAARHHQMFCDWLPESSWRAWVTPMRGAMPDETGVPDALGKLIRDELAERGLAGEPVGVDIPDVTTLLALQRHGIEIADSQPIMLEARKLKTEDELALLDHAAAIVDAAYEEIYRQLRPGKKESEIVAAAMKVLFELGSEHVEAINAISGDRCNPHPHTFSDRLIRPGDQAFFDIIHSFMGYRTCYYRTFSVSYSTPAQLDAYKQCREWLDNAIDLVRPGVTTDKIAEVWPTAAEIGMKDEHAAFGLQFGHGLGRRPVRVPDDLAPPLDRRARQSSRSGMVFALETYCPARDGRSAARIEEEVIVTPTGPQVITRFPADELLVAGRNYVNGADFVERGRDRDIVEVD